MNKGDKVGIVCCSNGLEWKNQPVVDRLEKTLNLIGLVPVFSDCIFAKEDCFSAAAKERAECLMDFYKNDEIKAIFDISGGDIANEILPYLDYDTIAQSDKMFWGYSDLTTLLNAIYAKTGKASVLYQVKNLVLQDSENQIRNFTNTLYYGKNDLFPMRYSYVRGKQMSGTVIGGNIRCFLKLAGTQYWPDMNGKILFLEARSGRVPQMVTYLSQLKQMGVWSQINGILLGTYTEMERAHTKHMKELILDYVDADIPIAYTPQIGHGVDSKALLIGQEMFF